ncbi:insulin-like growth factor-binding protein 6 [Monodelphis domestica]|uniref:insulin-like growth factor-binding protein 6 n=1 Tax=Monodelphis domestica TaxID=13616 RepID=UPI0024E2147C|nr:insulin-like growth factor-binding protein 6 [Monodelphis domestica]
MTPRGLLLLLLALLLGIRPGTSALCPDCAQGAPGGCPGGCLEEVEEGAVAAQPEGCSEAGGCVRREGEACGVYTPNCGPGLQCHPPEEDETPLRALLLGRGRCRRSRGPSGENPKGAKPSPGGPQQQDVHHGGREKNLATPSTPSQPGPGGGQDSEMGPCRRHLDTVLQQLQAEVYRGARTLYVPNCDNKGFYRKRQCRSSQGLRRGPCWCVTRMGQPLTGPSESDANSLCLPDSSG